MKDIEIDPTFLALLRLEAIDTKKIFTGYGESENSNDKLRSLASNVAKHLDEMLEEIERLQDKRDQLLFCFNVSSRSDKPNKGE